MSAPCIHCSKRRSGHHKNGKCVDSGPAAKMTTFTPDPEYIEPPAAHFSKIPWDEMVPLEVEALSVAGLAVGLAFQNNDVNYSLALEKQDKIVELVREAHTRRETARQMREGRHHAG